MQNGGAARVVCIGGAVADSKFYLDESPPAGFASLCGRAVAGFGGVARNVAENLARLGVSPFLVSLVGDDHEGAALVRDLERCALDTRFVVSFPGAATARYTAVIDPHGALVFEIADMTIFERLGDADISRAQALIASAVWVFADGNVPARVLQALAMRAHGGSYRLAVDVAAVPKAVLFPPRLDGIDLLFLNVAEAGAYLRAHGSVAGQLDANVRTNGSVARNAVACAQAILARGAAAVVITNGAEGAIVGDGAEGATVAEGDVTAIPAVSVERVVDVTGAGDALVAGTLARLVAGDDLQAAVRAGTRAASLTIQTAATVRADLAPASIAP
jgi:sugar/nucleoside kinase (ribokinase family)